MSMHSILFQINQFVVFKPLSYRFQEAITFDVKASFERPPVSHLIRPGDTTEECWKKAIQFQRIFHGLKIENCKWTKK